MSIRTILPQALKHRITVVALIAGFVLCWSHPLWDTAGKFHGYDWAYMANAWEVRWKTLFEYHQWPAHNPWQGGGIPVNPVPGYFSIQALATIIFGSERGLSVYVVTYLLMGAWGFFRLGRVLFPSEPDAATFLAVLGSLSPALAFHLAVGHVVFANIMVWPGILSFILTAESDRRSGLKAGLLFALGFNEMPFYVMQYGSVILAVGFIVRLIRGTPTIRRALLHFAVSGIAVALPLILPVTVAILRVAADYNRVLDTPVSFPLSLIWSAYFRPVTTLFDAYLKPELKLNWGSWEIYCYLGIVPSVLWLIGLARPRWYHLALIISFLFTIGNLHSWEPMHWLMKLPAFASLQSFNRSRLFTYLFFTIGAAAGLEYLLEQSRSSRLAHTLILAAGIGAGLEVAWVGHTISGRGVIAGSRPPVLNEFGGAFYQRLDRKWTPAFLNGWPVDLPLYTRANIGIVGEAPSIPPAFRQHNQLQVKAVGWPGYVAEFSQNGLAVKPDKWSPNHLVFFHLNPTQPLLINLNRGHPWQNFGQPLFPNDRIVEFNRPFVVQPNVTGQVDLTYRLPYERPAWIVAGTLGALEVFAWAIARRMSKRNRQA